MSPQHFRSGILWLELIDDTGPEQTGCPQFGNLHVKVHADAPEERQAWCKVIDLQPCGQRSADIFLTICQRVSHFQGRVRAGLLDVIAGNGDGVELGHVLGAMSNDVSNDSHGGFRRIDIGIADQELLQDVVLDRARKLCLAYTLFFCCDHVTGEDRQDGAIHSHGHGNLV